MIEREGKGVVRMNDEEKTNQVATSPPLTHLAVNYKLVKRRGEWKVGERVESMKRRQIKTIVEWRAGSEIEFQKSSD